MLWKNYGAALTCILISMLLIPLCTFLQAAENTPSSPLQIEGKTHLPLRVLARPYSNIYSKPDTKSSTVEENVPAFQSFYVYDKTSSTSDLDPLGWYQVGTDDRGTIAGWMNSDDVFEWKQTMCLSYTHPEGRYPVLMFDTKNQVEQLIKMPAAQRKQKVEDLYMEVAMGDIPPDFPIVTIEPKKAIDIAKQFYLLPILDFEKIEIDNREARILKLAAVTKAGATARESSDIRKNKDYLQKASQKSSDVGIETLKKLVIDVVWVMDTTNSMMPYINQTLKVIEKASQQLAQNSDIGQKIKFGIWGYRDSMDIPGIGYTVKNYTPSLEPIDTFAEKLKTVTVTTAGSQGYAEDMFSGMNSAIADTSWTPDAIKFIILAGDAPSHEAGHKWNSSKQNKDMLRVLANERGITIYALHIKDPKAEKYHAAAEEQFKTLSTNKGQQGEAAYFTTSSDDLEGFENATQSVTDSIFGLLEKIAAASAKQTAPPAVAENQQPATDSTPTSSGEQTTSDFDISPSSNSPNSSASTPANLDLFDPTETAEQGTAPSAKSLADAALQAALVEWIGSQTGAQAPRDITAWVTDKDLLSTDIQSLEVRLLINKRQLNALRETLTAVLSAGRQGQISGDDFFASLQAASASTARDPDMITQAKSLAETGLIPEFLAGLPYTSRIMDMNNELWSSWSIDEQDMFMADLEARIMAYETIHDAPEGWVSLNKGDDPGDYVYPITLELLP